MARRVLADFDSELLLRLANRTDVTETQRGFFLQDGYRWICNAWEHKELQGTVLQTLDAGEDSITLDSTAWNPVFVRNLTGDYPLNPADLDEIEEIAHPDSDHPSKYCWWGGDLVFDTTAITAQSLRIRTKATVEDFVTSPVIDQLFDVAIIMVAAIIGFETVRDFDEAAKQKIQFENWMKEVKLPILQEKLNDYRTGIQVRMR